MQAGDIVKIKTSIPHLGIDDGDMATIINASATSSIVEVQLVDGKRINICESYLEVFKTTVNKTFHAGGYPIPIVGNLSVSPMAPAVRSLLLPTHKCQWKKYFGLNDKFQFCDHEGCKKKRDYDATDSAATDKLW